MTNIAKIIFIGLVTLGLTPVGAQCPGGNCATRYYWTPFGFYNYMQQSCTNGKCAVKKAAEPEDPEPQVVEMQPFCSRVIELVNQTRQQAGLTPFAADASLSDGCDRHSRYMRTNGFGHAYGIGGYECIAHGVATPEAVVRLWLNSSGHRAILMGRGTRIGVGFSGTFWTLRVR